MISHYVMHLMLLRHAFVLVTLRLDFAHNVSYTYFRQVRTGRAGRRGKRKKALKDRSFNNKATVTNDETSIQNQSEDC